MKNLKVSMKLFVGFGVAIVLIVFVGVYSIINMRNINNDYSWAIDTHGEPLGDAAHMLEAIHSLRAEARGAIIFTGKLEQLQKSEALINDLFKKYEEKSAVFVKTVQMPESKTRLAEAKSTYEQGFKPAVQEILEGAKKGLPIEELSKIMLAKAKPNADKVAENVATVIEHKQGLLKKANSKRRRPYGETQRDYDYLYLGGRRHFHILLPLYLLLGRQTRQPALGIDRRMEPGTP